MKIVCISGKARHGKDLAAAILKDDLILSGKKVVIIHYADLLKFICKQYFGWNGEKDDNGRNLLQYIGTDVVRRKNPNFWVEFVKNLIDVFKDEWDYIIIPDCRFPNEIDCLHDGNYDVFHIQVVRPNFISPLSVEQQQHISETALDHIIPDVTLLNDGTVTDLAKKIKSIIAYL